MGEAMRRLKRFTRKELADHVRHLYPELEFSDFSVVKPMKQSEALGHVKLVQPSQGNKKQAVYEWVQQNA